MKKTAISLALLIVFLSGCGVIATKDEITPAASPSIGAAQTDNAVQAYDEATALLEQGLYLDAYYAYSGISSEDSAEKAKESLYLYADYCMNETYYIPAIIAYRKLNGYKDADSCLEEALIKIREQMFDNNTDEALFKFENIKLWVGDNNIYAINSSKELYAWGSYEYGQLGNGKKGDGDINTYEVEQNPIKILDNVTEVISGSDLYYVNTCYAFTDSGDLYAWGNNEYGQVGNGQKGDGDSQTNDCIVTEPVKVLSSVNSVWTVNNNVFALLSDGSLYAWGRNSEGSCGTGQSEGNVVTPSLAMKNASVKDISGGTGFTMVLMDNGDLYGWGRNYYGEIGLEEEKTYELENILEPTKILGGVKKIVCGAQYSMALTENGDLYTWGLNDAGQTGAGDEKNVIVYNNTTCVLYPTQILTGIVDMAAYIDKSFAISNNGALYGWGNNEWGHIDASKKSDGNWETKDAIVKTPITAAICVIAGSPYEGFIDEDGFVNYPGGGRISLPGAHAEFLMSSKYGLYWPFSDKPYIDYRSDLYTFKIDDIENSDKIYIMGNVKFAAYTSLGPLVILSEDMELYTCGEFWLTEPGIIDYGSMPPQMMIESIMAE